MVIGRNIIISIVTPDGDVDILAKVDTGAYSSSLDETFFKNLNLNERVIKNKMVRNVHGEEKRDVYEIDIAAIGRGGKPLNKGHIHYQCEEPGYIMGLMAITPMVDYSQGNDFDLNLQTIRSEERRVGKECRL